ncbi:FAD:protein FMN transferase [Aneurinibacillus terranovensis]|uniref:FAD:protein FMN transferase n=1 Tax=Aneurinibacillus terranovensis TaxID=278991 RepID=UPI0004005E8E|nr:FAD:protein FMN transferase [Aneurinibacillus terranovensis]
MHSFKAMNTVFWTMHLPQREQQQVESWVQYVEDKLSRFRATSELSRLNQSGGKPFVPSALLYTVLRMAEAYYRETDGLFSPFLGEEIRRLGYDRTFEELSPAVGEAQIYSRILQRKQRDINHPVQFNRMMKSVTLSPGVFLDFGGIAKGWSVQKISGWLKEDGITRGLINAGGDIVAWDEDGGSGWEITVANPMEPERNLARFTLSGCAGVATSSTRKRRWTDAAGTTQHHILDPRTGKPTASDLVQVTVIAPDVTTAEVYAKCLLVLGTKEAKHWLACRQPDLGVIAVEKHGKRFANEAAYEMGLRWIEEDLQWKI